MNILAVGCGLIGAQRIQALTRNRAVSSISVYDPKLPEGTELSPKAKTMPAAAAFGLKYDAAVVATPHDTAVDLLPQIVRLAPAVLVEKPLGRSFAEAHRMAAAAVESGSRIFVGFNYRFLKNVQHARRLIKSGEMGRVLAVDAVLSHGAQPGYENSWKTDPIRCGGGVCMDPGIHLFDLLFWLFGGAEVAGGLLSRRYWPIQVEDHASLILTLPGGAVANLFLSLSSWRSRMEMTVETETAQILVRGRGKYYGPQRLTVVSKWPWLQPQNPRETEYDYGIEDTSLQDETDEFVAAASGAQTTFDMATAEDALHAIRVVDSCYSKLSDTAKPAAPPDPPGS
jgi:predicted dehydrogenase